MFDSYHRNSVITEHLEGGEFPTLKLLCRSIVRRQLTMTSHTTCLRHRLRHVGGSDVEIEEEKDNETVSLLHRIRCFIQSRLLPLNMIKFIFLYEEALDVFSDIDQDIQELFIIY